MKKYVKWMLLMALLVALLTGCGKSETTAPEKAETPTYKIAWNVDRDLYMDDEGNSIRKISGDYYRLRFALDGGQSDLLFSDRSLVYEADSMKIMGLAIKEDGVVTDVVSLDEFTGGIGLMNYCVTEVTENTVTCSLVMTGTSPKITYTYGDKGAVSAIIPI